MFNPQDPTRTYFANLPTNELAEAIFTKIKSADTELDQIGMRDLWRKSYRYYYGKHWKGQGFGRGSSIMQVGKSGELSAATINHYRNIVKHVLVLTSSSKIVWDTKAVNDDSKSMVQTRIGNNVLNYFLRYKKLGRIFNRSAEQALVFSRAHPFIVWNPSLGKAVGTKKVYDQNAKAMREKIVYEGDIESKTVSCWDHWCDKMEDEWDIRQWDIVRVFENKYDLMVRYPDLAQKIYNLPSMKQLQKQRIDLTDGHADTDKVPVYHFYHKKTPACPNGRIMFACSSDCVPYDSAREVEAGTGTGAYVYDDQLPVFRMLPAEIMGTTEGYSDAFDLMGPQEIIDVLTSTAYTNLSTFGTSRILIPENSNLKVLEIAKGMVGLKYNPAGGKPELLKLAEVVPELFKMIDMMVQTSETLSGMNAAVRGNPEPFGKSTSGVAYGLFQTMAVQYASMFQENFASCAEDVGTFMLRLLKKFAQTKRLMAVAGESNRGYMMEFYAPRDLEGVDRVEVDLGNPAFRTLGGRIDFADKMLEKGMVKTPQDYITVINTGNLSPILRAPTDQVTLIKRENEDMQNGKVPPVLWTDAHIMHYREHMAQADNPGYRQNDAALKALITHADQHKAVLKQLNPFLTDAELYVLITGEPLPIPPPMPMVPPAPPGVAGGEQPEPPKA